MHTLDDLSTAKATLEALERRSDNYDGNNPDKYRASIADARVAVHTIESELKNRGLLPRSAKEELEHRLNLAFPNAGSKQVVDFKGKRYMCRFSPLAKSLSGKSVKGWVRSWDELPT
jgi:hypothetical protein